MANANQNLLVSCVRLAKSPEFKELREWIDEQQAAAMKVLASAQEDRQMYAAQGAYNTWQRLKDLLGTADSRLDKMAQR